MGMLTKRERQILDKLMVCDIDLAAQELGIKSSTIYVMRGRIRGKIEMAMEFLKEVKKYKRALGTSREWTGV